MISAFPGTVPRSAALTAILASMFFARTDSGVPPQPSQNFRRTSSIASLLTILALYALAAIYTIAVLVTMFHNPHIWDRDYPVKAPTLEKISTVVLTLTALFSNAVVWSRVWVLWGHNKILYGVSILLVVVTFILGAISTSEEPGFDFYENRRALWIGGFYWNAYTGVAACWFALFTNIIAFILYLVKALRLRSEKALSAGRRVGRHFVRILESGVLFAILWLFMAVYNMQAGEGALTTTDGFSFFVSGALISLLGSGAVLIILLAATGHSETALVAETADDEQGVPLSRGK
ncbi:hypothetical protein V8D89_011035 [Ganoderma adspersum]